MPPNCENCLIPKEQRCKPVKKTLGHCLKAVNQQVEPDISMPALKALIGDCTKPIQQFTKANDDLPPSISELLASGLISPHQIKESISLNGVNPAIQAYLIRFKGGSEIIMRP